MSVDVVPLGRSRGELHRFWKAGLPPYAGDPHFVVPLRMDCFDRWAGDHPMIAEAPSQHFIVQRDGRDVGRIAACTDLVAERIHGERIGNFGWFECENRTDSAHALLDAAASWLRERGRDRVRGPLSYNTNGISGLLVRDDAPGPPALDMSYNPPWYAELITSWGFEKAKDLLSFWLPTEAHPPGRYKRVVERLRKRGKLTVRTIRLDARGFAADLDHVLTVYNAAWAKNWGFVPMNEAEIRHQAKSFKPLLHKDFALFAEVDGEVVGFLLGIPDFNQALSKIRGRLWPWSVVRLLLARRRIDRVRVLTLGVLPEKRRLGVEAILIHDVFARAHRNGMAGGECGWILEDNRLMVAGLEEAGGHAFRAYRVYEAAL